MGAFSGPETNDTKLIFCVDSQNSESIEVVASQGQQAYTTSGTYSWTAPNGVTSVSVVCVGGGGGNNDTSWSGGGGGGALAYANNISVTPGQSYTVEVGAAGVNGVSGVGTDGGDSYFIDTSTVAAGGGETEIRESTQSTQVSGGAVIAGVGGAGGRGGLYGSASGYSGGGGGAGGYSGSGGDGGTNVAGHSVQVSAGSGGGGGGGWAIQGQVSSASGAGGGVGILGEGSSGAAGTGTHSSSQTNNDDAMGGRGGSGGGDGTSSIGGNYGGGADGYGDAAGGAVRIIWGTGRSFPSTNTADIASQDGSSLFNDLTDKVGISTIGNGITLDGNSDNRYLKFSGSGTITINSDFQVSTSKVYTVEAWIFKTKTLPTHSSMLISGGQTADFDGIVIGTEDNITQGDNKIISYNGDVAAIYYNGVSQTLNATSDGTDSNFSLNDWVYVVVTGIQVNSTDGGNHHIGGNTNGTNLFTGRISNFKIYEGTLTEEEVQENFNALKSRFGQDTLSWPFNLDNIEFSGKSPNYRYRNLTTDSMSGIFLKPDGTAFYTANTDNVVRRHDLSIPWDISTADFHSASSSTLSMRGMYFSLDGTKLFFVERRSSIAYYVRFYNLSTPWDITSMSIDSTEYDLMSQIDTQPTSLTFSSDGRRLYVSESNGSNDNYIHQFSLSVSWDISTISYVATSPLFGSSGSFTNNIKGLSWKPDGTKIYITHDNNVRIGEWHVSTPWDITTVSSTPAKQPRYYEVVEAFNANGLNVQWKWDGSIYYSGFGYSSNLICQFEPSTSWTLPSGGGAQVDSPGSDDKYLDYTNSYNDSIHSSLYACQWNNDGTLFYNINASSLKSNNVTTPYDIKSISTQHQSGSLSGQVGYGPREIKFNSTGTILLIGPETQYKRVSQFSLSTAFDLSTLSHVSNLDLTSGTTLNSVRGGCISDDGKYIYANSTNTLYQWTLSTAFDLSTASYTRSESIDFGNSPSTLKISPDGTQIIVHKGENVYQKSTFVSYLLTTPWDISTVFLDKSFILTDRITHVPPFTHNLPWAIANDGWYFFPYYKYFGVKLTHKNPLS